MFVIVSQGEILKINVIIMNVYAFVKVTITSEKLCEKGGILKRTIKGISLKGYTTLLKGYQKFSKIQKNCVRGLTPPE